MNYKKNKKQFMKWLSELNKKHSGISYADFTEYVLGEECNLYLVYKNDCHIATYTKEKNDLYLFPNEDIQEMGGFTVW